MLEVMEYDVEAGERFEAWLGNNAQHRKDYLDNFEFDMMSV